MNTIARFYKAEDAYLFRSYLESEGISAHVFDEHVPQVHWLYTHTIGGVRVVVAPEDSERAADFYKTYDETISAGPTATGDVKWWPLVLLVSVLCSVPIFAFGRKSTLPRDRNP
ncbi:hypothetical protein [Luteolibacter sp. AS25]|uniref:hypothetical protein n=1 Tax=Luteolibacter sp. AS25 TaxID=3135776 RepID=UPI00398A6624